MFVGNVILWEFAVISSDRAGCVGSLKIILGIFVLLQRRVVMIDIGRLLCPLNSIHLLLVAILDYNIFHISFIN